LLQPRVLVDIDFESTRPVASQLLEDRRHEPARSTPRRPEVDQHGRRRARLDIERLICRLDHPWQGFAARTAVRRPTRPRADGVSCAAVRAGEDRAWTRRGAGRAWRAAIGSGIGRHQDAAGTGRSSRSARTFPRRSWSVSLSDAIMTRSIRHPWTPSSARGLANRGIPTGTAHEETPAEARRGSYRAWIRGPPGGIRTPDLLIRSQSL
jgi:hypothetical protein